MEKINSVQVAGAISGFLSIQLDKKLEPELKRIDKAEKDGDLDVVELLKGAVAALREKYVLDTWMHNAATKMAGELKFGTHIAKGVHPDSKGDNVNFQDADVLPAGLVGSQLLASLALDANGNAASLPLASFFNTVVDELKGIKLRDLILSNHSSLEGVFSSKLGLSQQYLAAFSATLSNIQTEPLADERNKQLLWPNDDKAAATDNYTTVVPLHPSALTYALHQQLNGLRYSEANKEARDNRKKKTAEQKPYVSISDLAIKQLGGTKPQNISQLTSGQGGRNFLLPSLPPEINQQRQFSVSKKQKSIFNNSLRHHCHWGLQELFAVVISVKNTVEWRDQRKQALDIILAEVLGLAATIQDEYPVGWSREYELAMAEKYWLDPLRATLEGEKGFAQNRANGAWVSIIESSFSLWLNDILKRQFPKQKLDFVDAEHTEWVRKMQDAIKASQRAKQGVFL